MLIRYLNKSFLEFNKKIFKNNEKWINEKQALIDNITKKTPLLIYKFSIYKHNTLVSYTPYNVIIEKQIDPSSQIIL